MGVSRSQRHQESKVASTESANDCLVLHVEPIGQSHTHKSDRLEFEGTKELGVLESTVGQHTRGCTQAACLHLFVIRKGIHSHC